MLVSKMWQGWLESEVGAGNRCGSLSVSFKHTHTHTHTHMHARAHTHARMHDPFLPLCRHVQHLWQGRFSVVLAVVLGVTLGAVTPRRGTSHSHHNQVSGVGNA